MRTMMGFTPGPEMPPNLLRIAGRNVSMLILSPRMVLEMTSASAPAASAALAIATTSPAFGDSLHHTGLSVRPADGGHHIESVVLVHGEIAAARIAGRAGNIDLDDVDVRNVHVAGHRLEVIGGLGRDAAYQRWGEALVVRHLVAQEIFDALGRQPDRIDHAAFKLDEHRRGIADAEFAPH